MHFKKHVGRKQRNFGNSLKRHWAAKKTKQRLAEAILDSESRFVLLDDLTAYYQRAFSTDLRPQSPLQTISDPTVLDKIAASELLTGPIVSSSDSAFYQFIQKLEAMDWIRQGYSEYHDKADGVCPYCQQKLPMDFETQFASCVDAGYQNDIRQLQELLEHYRNAANELFIPLQNQVRQLDDSTELRLHLSHLKELKQRIKANIELIRTKLQFPSKPVVLQPTSGILSDVQADILHFNTVIMETTIFWQRKPRIKKRVLLISFPILPMCSSIRHPVSG